MKKLMVFAILMIATLSMSFAQTKMSKEAPAVRKERAMKGVNMDKIKAAMETAGVPLNPDQVTRLEAIYKAQKDKMVSLRADETLDDEAKKAMRKEMTASTKSEMATFLSEDQMAILGKMKKENRGKVGTVRPNRGNVDPAEMAAKKLEKMSSTLNEANVPLDRAQTMQLTALFQQEAEAMKEAKTQSRSEMGVKDIRKNIRKEYQEKTRAILTEAQQKALKAVRKAKKSKI